MTNEIEYELVTVKLPKVIVNWFRRRAKDNASLFEEEIQFEVIDSVRSNMEAMSGEELVFALGFDELFYKLLDDESYKPKTTDQEVKQP
jgi:hypothetical protein